MSRNVILTILLLLPAGCSSLASDLEDLESKEYEDRKEAILSLARRLRKSSPGSIDEKTRQKAMEGIRAGLDDSSAMVRSVAVGAVRSLLDRPSIPRVVSLLQDRSWLVRLSAIVTLRALGAAGDASAMAEILRSDTNPHCRREAAITVGAFRSREGVEACIQAISEEESDFSVRVAAWEALKAISGKDLPMGKDDWTAWWAAEGPSPAE